MNQKKRIFWGVVLVVAGVLFALNALDLVKINLFFDGWWTLFIIIPSAVGLFTEREKLGNAVGVVIGIALLLCCRGILSFALLWKLFVPAVIVIVGLKLVLSGIGGNHAEKIISSMKENGSDPKIGFAAFSGTDLNFDGEVFDGAELTAVFGGVKCDLRRAVIEKDAAIKVSAVFGGIDILVPPGVNVKSNSTAVFGGISNKTAVSKDAPTVYVNGLCLFGGVEIK